jgi:histidinol-phosphate/aromatic aminotransferase/cobyric acid decarboxylase-like protein
LSELEARVHGGRDPRELARLGLERAAVLDLSVNVNPFGPHPRVLEAAQRAALGDYPDPLATAAREAVARSCDVDPARVLIGHGSAELLWAAVGSARAADPQRPLLSVAPTFSEPALAAQAWGVPLVQIHTHERDDFALDVRALEHAIAQHAPAAVYLCQPNNPDGGALPHAELYALCAAHPRSLFIVDQAFLSLSMRHTEHALRLPDNALLVRSLTKDHALPGLRVGYALGSVERIRALAARRPSWMVSAPAEAAIVAACAQPEHVRRAREFLLAGKVALADGMCQLGIPVVPSLTHFFLARVGDADALRERLLTRHAVLVRSGRSFGLPNHIRIAGCGAAERQRALAALREEYRP